MSILNYSAQQSICGITDRSRGAWQSKKVLSEKATYIKLHRRTIIELLPADAQVLSLQQICDLRVIYML